MGTLAIKQGVIGITVDVAVAEDAAVHTRPAAVWHLTNGQTDGPSIAVLKDCSGGDGMEERSCVCRLQPRVRIQACGPETQRRGVHECFG